MEPELSEFGKRLMLDLKAEIVRLRKENTKLTTLLAQARENLPGQMNLGSLPVLQEEMNKLSLHGVTAGEFGIASVV